MEDAVVQERRTPRKVSEQQVVPVVIPASTAPANEAREADQLSINKNAEVPKRNELEVDEAVSLPSSVASVVCLQSLSSNTVANYNNSPPPNTDFPSTRIP